LSPSTPEAGDGRPELPPGRVVELPGLGELHVREAGSARPGQPTLVLLHGWTATADLNWYPAYGPLGLRHHVIAADLRGHGRGLRRPERFRLADCADDVAALADQLGLPSIVPVGYSMGGLVAQLLWQRHRDRVAGLVLCATSRNFRGTPGDHLFFNGLTGLAVAGRLAPPEVREQVFAKYLEARIGALDLGPWGADEIARHDLRCLLEAGAAIGMFSSHRWIVDVDVPTSVVVTTADTKIPPSRQRKLAAAVPGARVFEVDADHHACPRQADRFVPALLDAVAHVVGAGAD
jgi:3-oxoadipate enol-lactonase